VVAGQRNGGCVTVEIFKCRRMVSQEAKVTAGAEESIEKNVKGDENGKSGVERRACTL